MLWTRVPGGIAPNGQASPSSTRIGFRGMMLVVLMMSPGFMFSPAIIHLLYPPLATKASKYV